MQSDNPRVFLSHASEDKDRFVLDFATRLYEKGIEAWVERWEMLPGDSLIDRIFEEGIAQAQAMIVVISEYSVNKPWVREELNAGMVRKINGASKLIPVVMIGSVDDSQMPESLKATVWERIADLSDYDSEFETIVRAVYGQREKPKLGDSPPYTRMAIDTVPGLEETDSLVLKLCCEAQMEEETLRAIFIPSTIFEQTEKVNLPEGEVLEILEVLENRGYVKLTVSAERNLMALKVTDYGFGEYARTFMPEYDSAFRTVALDLVNHKRNDSRHVVEATGLPSVLVEHVLNHFDYRGFIGVKSLGSGLSYIHTVSPELKRWLRTT